ncbi:hypothetical protein BHE74_00051663 [Ensete ventricosum]|nr:hypothetical protein BHE74_00051663 [Ensete ventricosum]
MAKYTFPPLGEGSASHGRRSSRPHCPTRLALHGSNGSGQPQGARRKHAPTARSPGWCGNPIHPSRAGRHLSGTSNVPLVLSTYVPLVTSSTGISCMSGGEAGSVGCSDAEALTGIEEADARRPPPIFGRSHIKLMLTISAKPTMSHDNQVIKFEHLSREAGLRPTSTSHSSKEKRPCRPEGLRKLEGKQANQPRREIRGLKRMARKIVVISHHHRVRAYNDGVVSTPRGGDMTPPGKYANDIRGGVEWNSEAATSTLHFIHHFSPITRLCSPPRACAPHHVRELGTSRMDRIKTPVLQFCPS